jgi:predicted amidohydrolase YtcJ
MAFGLGDGDGARIRQAVEWAYGTEDLLALEPTSAAALHLYLDAIEQTGLADVWARKRPRVEHPGPAAAAVAPRLAANGMVVVERPGARAPLRTLLRQGVRLALASGGGLRPFDVLAWATGPDLGVEALTMEEAVMALTRGSAYAELADRDKGHLTVGALADLAVLSIDPFTAAPDALAGARSVLTLVGGRIVHDVP